MRRLTEDLFLAAKLEQKQVLLNEDRARLEALTAAVCSACQAEAATKEWSCGPIPALPCPCGATLCGWSRSCRTL